MVTIAECVQLEFNVIMDEDLVETDRSFWGLP